MDACTHVLVLLLPETSGLILPMTDPSGAPDLTSILNNMTLMEQTISTLQTQAQLTNDVLTTVMSKQLATETELVKVKADLKDAESNIAVLQHDLEKDDLKEVQQDLRALETDVAVVKHDVQKGPDPVEFAMLKSEMESLEGTLNNTIHDQGSKAKDKTDHDVAFQVSQLHSSKKNWTTLIFDTVDYNAGSGYDNVTGWFTAPVSGTYIFWANVLFSSPKGDKRVYIKKRVQVLATAFTKLETEPLEDYRTASVVVVAHLDKMNEVHFTVASKDSYISHLSIYDGALVQVS